MSIHGIDISSWTTVSDWNAMVNDQLLIDFAYIRAHDGYRDDAKFPDFRKAIINAKTKNGSVLWGPYMFLGYSGAIGSRTWTAVRGDYQAQNCWDLATGGGREFPLPVAVDVERMRWWKGKAFQVVPLPSAKVFCDTYLIPAIEFLSEKQGRRPVFYCNPDLILNYLLPLLSQPAYSAIGECALWLANWTKMGGEAPYMASIRAKTPWKSHLIHQYVGDVKDFPGIDDVDLNRGSGTRAMWKAWIADETKLPIEGGVEPPPPPPPPVEPPPPPPPPVEPPSDLAARVGEIERILAVHHLKGV